MPSREQVLFNHNQLVQATAGRDAYQQQEGDRQARRDVDLRAELQRITLTQNEEMRMQRLRQALSHVDEQVGNGYLQQNEGTALQFELTTGLNPLVNRSRETQSISAQLQQQQSQQQIDATRQRMAVDLRWQTNATSETGPARYTDPEDGSVWRETAPRHFTQSRPPRGEMTEAQQAQANVVEQRRLDQIETRRVADLDRRNRQHAEIYNHEQAQLRHEDDAAARIGPNAMPGYYIPEPTRGSPQVVSYPDQRAGAPLARQREAVLNRRVQARLALLRREEQQGQQQPSPQQQGPPPEAIQQPGAEPTQEPQPWDFRQPRTREHVAVSQAISSMFETAQTLPQQVQAPAMADIDRLMRIITTYGSAAAMPPQVRAEYGQLVARLQRVVSPPPVQRPGPPPTGDNTGMGGSW